ncbi:MAG TPA: glucose-6-phosphate isomerase [Gammaproteobacteria bacterium]|jgi:glucose-6-phosphate isomerase|nr:glucose-6-phosphate isomerase [Gammaproteobacteria bacterium]
MNNITESKPWLALASQQRDMSQQHLRTLFAEDPSRALRFRLSAAQLHLDYSRNHIHIETLTQLAALADAAHLSEKREALFTGEAVNSTEQRPALHTALRDKKKTAIFVEGKNIADQIKASLLKMEDFAEKVRQGVWQGVTGKAIQHVVNIGIGGSHTGPLLCTEALKPFATSSIRCDFISSVDNVHIEEVLCRIDPETTLFVISSKSFGTLETLSNAKTVLAWMQARLGSEVLKKHFVAVTAEQEKARAFGFSDEQIFPLWSWVGGRYSVWSAIGLPIMLQVGVSHFRDFLAGADEMDQHFRTAPFLQNMPVVMALLGIWYINFFGSQAHAVVPYAHRLQHFLPYLQQADMESNGKRTRHHGDTAVYRTGPVLFGAEGSIGQHAYHQLLHQGNHLIPVDFILVGQTTDQKSDAHQNLLLASGLSQAQALLLGKTYEEAYTELASYGYTPTERAWHAKHRVIPGNKPSNILYMDCIDPKRLGALIALYEHKIFVQGVIWEINSFDQWGIELGKQLLPAILARIHAHDKTKTFWELLGELHS